MFQSLFDSSTIPLLQKVAAFTERRNEVLAGNIANISTPHYKSRDLPVAEFQKALHEAVSRRAPEQLNQAGWSFTPPAEPMAKLFPGQLFTAVDSPRGVTFQDGNNRSVEAEMMELTKNSLLQNMAIELMTSQFSRLQAVISERA